MSTHQNEVVLSVVKTIAGKEEAWWDDKAYEAEMDKRFIEMENDKLKGLTLEELETGARQAYKIRKRKN